MGSRAAGNLAVRTGQLGAELGTRIEQATKPVPEADDGSTMLDIGQQTDALRTFVFNARPLEKEPELFYGPFMQLGSRLKLGPGWMQFLIDTVTDPLTYATAGTGGFLAKAGLGITEGARAARLTSVLVRGAEEAGGAAALDEMGRALEAAGKILGSPKRAEMLQAARTGDKAFVGLIDEAMKGSTLAPEIATTLQALQKDRKAMAFLLDNSHELLGYEKLPAHLIPQSGYAAKVLTGQATPLLQFGIPSPNPLNLSRQLIGIGYRGEKFLTPFGRTMASYGLRNLKGEPAGMLTEAALRSAKGFSERAYQTGEATLGDLDFTLSHLEAALGVPSDHVAREVGLANLSESAIGKVWKRLPEAFRRQVDKSEFMGKVLGRAQLGFVETDKARLLARDAELDAIAGRAAESARPYGPLTPEAEAALAPEMERRFAQVRRFADLFSMNTLAREGASGEFHLAMSARARAVSQWASIMDGQARDILIRNSGTLNAADDIDSVLRYVREIPEAWEARNVDGVRRLFLAPDKVPKGGLFADRLALSPPLTAHLTEKGLSAEAEGLSWRIGNALDRIGANLQDEKALTGWLEHYWPATFKRNQAFGRRFGEGPEAWSRMSQAVLYEPESLSDIAPELMGDFGKLKEAVKAGKLSPLQTRRVADDLRAALERAGYGRYEPSSLVTAAHALDAYGKALLERRLLIDGPTLGGTVAWNELPRWMQKTLTPEAINGKPNWYGDGSAPPDALAHAYMKITMRSGRPEMVSKAKAASYAADVLGDEVRATAHDEAERLLRVTQRGMTETKAEATASIERLRSARDRAEAGLVEARDRSLAAVREVVADRMAGRKVIKKGEGTIRIRVAKSEDVKLGFQREWALLDDYPEGLAMAKEVRAHVLAQEQALQDKILKGFDTHRSALHETASDAARRLAARRGETSHAIAKSGLEALAGIRGRSVAATFDLHEAARKVGQLSGAPPKAVIHVRKDLASHFIEPFSLWEQHGLNQGAMQALGKLNATLKGTVLLGDVYHMHSLTVNQLAANPTQLWKLLLDPKGDFLPGVKAGAWGETEQFAQLRRGAFVKAGVGAVVGAAAGAGFGEDAQGTATLSVVGALYGAALGAAKLNAAWGKRLALSPEGYEFLHWMARAGWSGRPDDRSIGMVTGWLRNLRNDLVRKHGDQLLVHPIDGARHVNELWEKELWATHHNGGKHWMFATMWADEAPKLEKAAGWASKSAAEQDASKVQLARQLVQFTNNALGGQNVAALLAHPKWIHYARWGLLAPDWTAGRMQMASGYYHGLSLPMQALVGAAAGQAIELAEAGFDTDEIKGMGAVGGAALGVALGQWGARINERMMTQGDVLARRARSAASTALVSGFVVAALMNKALSGHWIWENEEGKKTAIELAGRTETGRKRYAQLGKQWLEAYEFASISEKDQFAVPFFGRLASKLSVPVGALVHLTSNDNGFGPIVSADDSVLQRAYALTKFSLSAVSPILVSGPAALAGRALTGAGVDKGGATEAALRFAGFPLTRSPRPMSSPLNAGAFLNTQAPPLIGAPSLLESRL